MGFYTLAVQESIASSAQQSGYGKANSHTEIY